MLDYTFSRLCVQTLPHILCVSSVDQRQCLCRSSSCAMLPNLDHEDDSRVIQEANKDIPDTGNHRYCILATVSCLDEQSCERVE